MVIVVVVVVVRRQCSFVHHQLESRSKRVKSIQIVSNRVSSCKPAFYLFECTAWHTQVCLSKKCSFSLFLRDCVIHYCSGYYPPCVFSYVKSRHTFVAAAVVTWVLLGVLFSARILKRLFVVFVSEPITSFPYLGSRMRVIYLLAVYNTVQKQTGLRTCSRSYRRFIPV